jgi:hypothetical protein
VLESEFDDDVEVEGCSDEGKTGRFEVIIEQSGELIHSKATKGHSKCETTAEQQSVIDAVKDYIDNA